MIISTPFYISENIKNSPYIYAAATFTQILESELFKQTLIPALISAGLVFNSKESIEEAAEDTIEWLKQQGFDWKPPDEPDGPNLEDVIKEMLKAVTLVSASHALVKGIVEIPKMLWDLVKSFVDDNYDEGDNIIGNEIPMEGYINGYAYKLKFEGEGTGTCSIKISVNDGTYYVLKDILNDPGKVTVETFELINISQLQGTKLAVNFKYRFKVDRTATGGIIFNSPYYVETTTKTNVYSGTSSYPENPYPEFKPLKVYGTPDIVDNSEYDWNNEDTNTKTIPISLETDLYGNLKTDENGYYLPAIDTETWIDVQPTEIPNLDPSGTPIPDIPPFPDIENPDNDEQTGIMVYIGNVLQIIVGQLSKIVEGINTIVSNTNQLVFNTPNPVFDPITGEQIDPETGQPVEPEPVVEEGDGIIGNGIDTNIPTDFEWGSFRHFLDIFFIFIYFIVILILIILKFLQVVFVGIPNVPANTDLFTQYPSILEGVDYVKNLQVGGLPITVHQAFEFVFMIFFYIFIIKQIRKLYNAYVFEQPAENQRITKDMKMDYYDNIKYNRWSDDK
jgi:hypothetical protein